MKSVALLICALCLAAPAFAAAEDDAAGSLSSIAAVVNDDIISSVDLENRLRLVLATTQLGDTEEVRARLRPQIVRALIDEKLQMQEAARNSITVTQADVDNAVHSIEQQRGLEPGSLLPHLDQLGVRRSTFLDQVRAQLAWTQLIIKKIRPNIKISDDEVERERGRASRPVLGGEVQIEVLALPVDHPERDSQVRALAEKLGSGIRGGAPFESVARELGGSSATQAQNIAPFWVPVDQLDPALAKALEHTREGMAAGPVRTLEGYTLARLIARRSSKPVINTDITEVVFKDILLKLKQDASQQDANVMLSIGREVQKHPGTCSENGVAGLKNTADYDIAVNFRSETLQALPPQLHDIITKLSVGGVSEPFASESGIRLFMLCERLEKPGVMTDREEALQRIYQQKLELEAQKYLRNLRREATVDFRV